MPDMWVDVDTAVTVPVNLLSLLDDTDFKTRETAVAYNAAGMDLVWNFVTSAGVVTQTAVTPTTAGVYDWTHVGDGIYKIEIPASGGASINNDTEGYGWFSGLVTGVLPWRGPVIGFRRAALNDMFVDGSAASTNFEDDYDGTGYAGGTIKRDVNVEKWNATDVPAEHTAGYPIVTVKDGTGTGEIDTTSGKVLLADGAHGGTAATITVERVIVAATTTNEPAVKLTGNGSGAGMQLIGGASGSGLTATGATNGHGILATGAGTGEGIHADGGTSGSGIQGVGGATGGSGILGSSSASTATGIRGVGGSSGVGISGEGLTGIQGQGTDGRGIYGLDIGTNGHGAEFSGAGTGDGIQCSKGASGADIDADITGNITGNLSGSAGSVTGSVGSVAAAGITAASFAAGAIDAAAVADNAIDAGAIAANAITAAKIATDAITSSKIATDAIGAAQLSQAAADKIIESVSGTADSGTTTTLVDAARTEADTDYWKGAILLITSGNLAGQRRRITSFTPGTDTITVDSAFTQAVGTHTYTILRTAYGEAPAAGSGDWTAAEKEQIRDALGVDGTKTAATGGDVQDIQGRLPAALVSGRMSSDAVAISGSTAAADDVEAKIANLDATVSSRATPAQVNTEVDTALADVRLDELLAADSDIDGAAPPTVGSVFHELMTKTTGSFTYDQTTDSLEAIRDKETDIETDTQDIQGRLPAALVSGRIDSSVGAMAAGVVTAAAIATGAVDADALASDAVTEIRSLVSGTSDSGSTTTMVDAARSEGDTDYWKGCRILFTSGSITGQARLITAFDPATDTITFAPPTTQAVSTQTYEILPAARVDVELWDGSAVNSLISGRVDANAQIVGDKTGYSIGSGGIVAGSFAGGAIDATAIAANAITAAKIATDAVSKIAAGVGPQRNAAFAFDILMVDSTDHVTPKTGLTVSGTRKIDSGSFAAMTGTITEVSNGYYRVAASAADMNGAEVTFKFTGTGADDSGVTIITTPA